MADYIYLLQTRLTPAQQNALDHVRESARSRAMTVFLVGGAVRDLTTGSPIRDLDFAIQGDATKLKKDLQRAGGTLLGEDDPTRSLHFSFPGGVRLEVGTTLSASYPKPGKPVFHEANILDDLRRRDFTANAMAISLNDGSFGLLMDPLNGVADLENRELRLVSNYGFIEDPSRMIRAVRFGARLGWQMEEKTAQRYETGKSEDYMAALHPAHRKYELEEIFHEEDPLRVLRRLEAEGWAKVLFPAWTSAKVNEAELERLRDVVGQLDLMGIHPDPSAAYFPLLTAKLAPKDVAELKKSFARPGFAEQINALDAETKAFAAQFTGKAAAAPSDAWKMLFAAPPEPVLWLAHTTKSAPLQARFKAFFEDWSQARQKIPYQLMQEMRITPALPGYDELIETLFYAVMDAKLDTPEAAKAFLEPYSPPAPPPPVNVRRRAVKRETKAARPRSKKAATEVSSDELDLAAAGAAEIPPAASTADGAKSAVQPKSSVKTASAKTMPAKGKSVVPAVKAAAVASKRSAPAKAAAKPAVKSAAAKPAKQVARAVTRPATRPAAKPVAKKGAVKPSAKKPVKKVSKPTAPARKKLVAKSRPVSKARSASSPAAKRVAKKVARPAPKARKKTAGKPKGRR